VHLAEKPPIALVAPLIEPSAADRALGALLVVGLVIGGDLRE